MDKPKGVAKLLALERGQAPDGANSIPNEPKDSNSIDISRPQLDFSRSRHPAISLQSAEVAAPKSD